MPSKPHRTIRERLYAADPHCHWCKCWTRQMSPQGGRLPDDAATLDHFRSRLDPLRGKIPGEPRYVLACHRCNQRRGAADTARFGTGLRPRSSEEVRMVRFRERREYPALLQEASA